MYKLKPVFCLNKLDDVINAANNNKWPSMTSTCNASLLLQQTGKSGPQHLNHAHHHHHPTITSPFTSLLSASGSPGYLLGSGDPLGLNKVVNSSVNHLY
ncbi:hypothetical protein RUM43_006054 [Polyplax serrata]|uniref:Uncharacterized protein n=1 Tax=Polyplax serrata TaxID=468196 RepID=A0AAN8PKJ1_POLSC